MKGRRVQHKTVPRIVAAPAVFITVGSTVITLGDTLHTNYDWQSLSLFILQAIKTLNQKNQKPAS